MKKEKKQNACLQSFFRFFLVVFLGLAGPPLLAAPGSRFTIKRVDPSLLLPQGGEETKGHGYKYIEGEIIEVKPGECWLLGEDGAKRRFVLGPDARVYINGLPGDPWAMRPVTPEAFFWAGIWGRNDEAVAVEAVYYGGELVVEASFPEGLRGWSPERQMSFFLPVRKGLRLDGLRPGQMVYVLLDLEGRIRRFQVLPAL
ncbi:MAG: hypothetical protein ACUVRM_00860 [Bacillota bacterium]